MDIYHCRMPLMALSISRSVAAAELMLKMPSPLSTRTPRGVMDPGLRRCIEVMHAQLRASCKPGARLIVICIAACFIVEHQGCNAL